MANPVVSDEQFKRDGYIALPALYDQQEITEINQNLERYIRDVVPNMPTTHVYYEDKQDLSSLKQIQKLFEFDAYFSELISNSRIRSIAESLLQESVVPVNLQYFNKPAGVSMATPPHQDGYYFHLKPCRALTGWLALEDVDEENGCIHYVRGSHKDQGFRPHSRSGVLGFSQGITDFGHALDQQNTVGVPGAAGTFLIHDAKTIHFAAANQSRDRSRRALGFIYYAESAQQDLESREAYQKTLDQQLQSEQKI